MELQACTIEPTTAGQLRDTCGAMLLDYWVEATGLPRGDCNPDWEQYEIAEAHGFFRAWWAKDGEGRVVGYVAVYVYTESHNRDRTAVTVDSIYVAPEDRCTGAGLELTREVVRFARSIGVKAYMNATPGSTLERVLEGLDFRQDSIRWCKE